MMPSHMSEVEVTVRGSDADSIARGGGGVNSDVDMNPMAGTAGVFVICASYISFLRFL